MGGIIFVFIMWLLFWGIPKAVRGYIDDREEEKNRQSKIHREEQSRLFNKAKSIKQKYPQGYQKYEEFVYSIYKKFPSDNDIIESESSISTFQNKFDTDEKPRLIKNAERLRSMYPLGYKYYVCGSLTTPIDTEYALKAKKYESQVKDKHYELSNPQAPPLLYSRLKSNNTINQWQVLNGAPYYFFYWYYPKRYTIIDQDDIQARHLIWNFKDGDFGIVLGMLKKLLSKTFSPAELKELTLVCIPASTKEKTTKRYEMFMDRLNRDIGIGNSFNKVSVLNDRETARDGGDGSINYKLDSVYFKRKIVIIFDDVVTRGRSMAQMNSELEKVGAFTLCTISIGKTYSDYFGKERLPHPWILDSKK